ncbi:uncharacterized protein A4U43_C03F30040 [Asparagus officinalis]|uniref:Uncharacterized protein n=1 Tax=Asparagus officinalis TaxID=4686 RepID=A0A5P1FE07_ASPOF|nr:uncharacterized protein A4U43_C03F30040 [Asparagus officinalis]
MGPGLYIDIGKKARDLLYKDYQTHQKFTLTTVTANGVAITASSTRKNEMIFGEIQSQLKNKNVTVDVKANSDSNVELQYFHEYAGVNASIGLTANPVVNLAGVFGSGALAVGADVSFDTATGNFTKYNAGLSLINSDLVAALNLNNKGDSLSASYYHVVSPLTSTAVGAEMTHSFSSNENTLTFGTQHALDPLTTVKARFDNYGRASALLQHQWRPKSFVTISGEVDTKAIEKSSKVGLSLVLKP